MKRIFTRNLINHEKTEKNIFNQIIQPTNELFVIN